MSRLYGCYFNSNKYRWDCKEANDEKEATDYCLENKKSDEVPSVLIEFPPYTPRFLDNYFLFRQVNRLFRVKIKD
jgi:hypothetical protein